MVPSLVPCTAGELHNKPPSCCCQQLSMLDTMLCSGLAEASSSVRRDVRQRLLNLFSDLGLRVGSCGSSGARAVAEMRALLPALAAACQNLGSDVTESLRRSATHPWLNSAELGHGKLDTQLVKVRSLLAY